MSMQEDINQIKSMLNEQNRVMKTHTEQIDRIQADLVRYKGFLGGVMFLITAMVGFVEVFKDWFLAHIK
jgi:hypothetical protein